MIILKKLNGEEFVLNSDLIETIMETPDTTILLTNGKHLIVRESKEDVVKKVVEFRRDAFRAASLPISCIPPKRRILFCMSHAKKLRLLFTCGAHYPRPVSHPGPIVPYTDHRFIHGFLSLPPQPRRRSLKTPTASHWCIF